MVPKVRFELTRPYGHYALNVARLPFRHFGTRLIMVVSGAAFNRIRGFAWWAVLDSNQ